MLTPQKYPAQGRWDHEACPDGLVVPQQQSDEELGLSTLELKIEQLKHLSPEHECLGSLQLIAWDRWSILGSLEYQIAWHHWSITAWRRWRKYRLRSPEHPRLESPGHSLGPLENHNLGSPGYHLLGSPEHHSLRSLELTVWDRLSAAAWNRWGITD